MNSTPEERLRRPGLVAALVPGGLGLLFLYMSLTRPGAHIRFHDLVRLLATGGFLGVGLVMLVLYFRGHRFG